MISAEPRARQIRAIIERFEHAADETTSPYFRSLMLSTILELAAIAALLETGGPIDELTGDAA